MEHTVKVWDKPHTITIHQEPASRSVWIAVGDYMGESIRVKGRSENTAKKRWIEAAIYKGNLSQEFATNTYRIGGSYAGVDRSRIDVHHGLRRCVSNRSNGEG